ncbi:hypothetical protein K9N68_04600 [Kovacikia minuta CCNUW1]|uniref:hypothetical protein n=1 Tax=Kovacikia minuta TaxID=2931930 RepID=UPI001CCDE44F|nr:hypothetical protein [Kovacikia minuta]UBF27250.1 hypothetical protein K9N68_04600 [Kovacikia minuta CCNUW1]
MKTDSFSYEQLEQLTTTLAPQQNPDRKKLSGWFAGIGKLIGQMLFHPEYEPRVWERVDAKGEHYWEVFDPTTTQREYFASELEVRIRLDKGAAYRY